MAPESLPLYLTPEQAAEWAGIGQNYVRALLNSADPPAYIAIGSKRLIQAAAWPAYLERQQDVREVRR